MVLEDMLGVTGKRRLYSLFLGILYVLISYGTALLFFPSYESLAMIFFITLLLLPSSYKLITMEEKIERRYGLKNFLKNHLVIMEIFLFLFTGIFIGYLIVGNYDADSVSYQDKFLEERGISGNFARFDMQNTSQLMGILTNNISVIIFAFVLSIFYGIGALFLIVVNASIFAGFVLKLSSVIAAQKLLGMTLGSVHIILEVFGFLLASVAGGVISKAVVKEKTGSPGFRNVVKDSTILLILSLIIILIAALIETFVTPGILKPLLGSKL